MSYYMAKTVQGGFDETIERVTDALKAEGFGVLTQINVQATMKEKLGIEFRPYRILGACNPPFAHRALTAEEHIGTMLPCNVIVQEKDGAVEVAAIDPVASMQAVENPELIAIAGEVREKLARVIAAL
jgi:uncharacterized protein (DUF302 family)